MKKPQEIPQLKVLGLYAAKTLGDGNCLFNALSDQMHGNDELSMEYRLNTVEYMKKNPERFKAFIAVNEGGGARRNPKRKTAGSLQSKPDLPAAPSQRQIDKAFEQALEKMSHGGTYGDNAEIVAFAQAFRVNVKILEEEHGFFYVVGGSENQSDNLPTLWIVHHSWEHFSSIRNINGPHTGLPNISLNESTPEAKKQLQQELAEGPKIEPWMIDIAMKSLPWPVNMPTNRSRVEQVLKQCNGNVNYAVSVLMPDSSPESSSRSSSIERDPDSDDERAAKPNKKRDRRISRPHPLRNDLAVQNTEKDMASPDPRRLAEALQKVSDKEYDPEETEEENWQDGSQSKSESSSASSDSSSPQAEESKERRIHLKINGPKKQESKPAKFSNSSTKPAELSSTGDYEADVEKKVPHNRVKAKPRRRLISGHQRDKELAERAARNANTKKLDMRIQAIHI